jgi:hypothetical protein
MALTPQEELKKLLGELKSITGRSASMDPNQVKDVAVAIERVTRAIENAKKSASELSDDFRTTTDTLNAAYNSLEGIDKFLKRSLSSEFRKLDTTIKSIRNTHQSLLGGYADEKKILNNINKLKNSIANVTLDNSKVKKEEIKDLLSSLEYTQTLAEEQLKIVQYSRASTENIDKFSNLLSEIPVIGKSLSGPFRDISTEIQDNITKEQTLTLELNAQKEKREILFKQIKRATKAGKFDLSKELKEDFKKSLEETKDFKEELDGIPSKFDIIKNKIKQVSIQGLSIGILTKAFITLKSAITDIDDQSTQLARSLSISKQEGIELRNTFNNIARDSSLTTKELVEAQLSFTKLTGIAVKLSESNIKALAESKDLIGLSENAQKGLISFAETTGEEYNSINNTVLGTSKITQLQNGLMMDQKEILDAVLSTSNLLRIQFGNNAQEITRAVVEAKRLGFTLQDIEGVQSNLLNFESSIAAELEAELLTGKELNLERARYHALTGDIRGLTQEINRNMGDSADFERMNVIQREAFAKSLGFSAEKLAEILITQEQNDRIAQSLQGRQAVSAAFQKAEKEMNAENLALLISQGKIDKDVINSLGDKERSLVGQLSMQQEFNRAVENLKEVFVSLMQGPVGSFIGGMTDLLNGINNAPWVKMITGPAMLGGLLTSIGLLAAGMIRGSTPFTPLFVKDIMGGLGGGAGGGAGMFSKRGLVGRLGAGGARNWMRGMKGGGIAAIGGLATTALTNKFTDKGTTGNIAGNMAGQALSMGGTGAMIGTMIAPGIGTAIGAGLGALGGAIMGYLDATSEEEPELHKGGIITRPTRAKVHSNEAVVPLDPFYAKLDELIVEVKAIGNMRVVLDDGILIGHMTNGGTKTGG